MKKNYTLYLEIEPIEELRANGVNISQFLNGLITAENDLKKGKDVDDVTALKLNNIKLITEIEEKRKELKQLKAMVKEKDEIIKKKSTRLTIIGDS